MEEIEEEALDPLRLGKQGGLWGLLSLGPHTSFGECLVGTACSDEEWPWCSRLLGNLEINSIHHNCGRHTNEVGQTPMMPHPWFISRPIADLE